MAELPQNLFFSLLKSTKRHTNRSSRPSLSFKPHSAGSPAGGAATPALPRDVRKGAVSIVVIENAGGVLGNKQIREPIAIVITDRYAHTIAAAGNTGCHRHVDECAVPIIAVKRVAQRLIGIIEVAAPTVDQINVHPTVVVVIEKSAAGASRFWE